MSLQSASPVQLRHPWLVLAQAAWIILIAMSLGLFVAGVSARYQQLITLSGSALGDNWTQGIWIN